MEKRRDTEFWNLRLTLETLFNRHLKAEGHAVLNFMSPPLTGVSNLAYSTTRSYLSLQHDFIDNSEINLKGSLDRLNLQIDYGSVRIVSGKQAISWGVTYFWPSMDIFSPFAPQQIDRDYKPGVDAIRAIIPLGAYSEMELIGAVLGSSLSRDGAVGALTRIYLGPVDIGLMGGRFHQDTVAGSFFTANILGTGLRGEVTWTRSGDPQDRERDWRDFWRGSVGIDRQLIPDLSLTAEFYWNGYGADDVSEYTMLSDSDRIQRGEVNTLGQLYTGISTEWQLHPLWRFSNVGLVNWQDSSYLWVPSLQWSTGDNSEALFGAQVGIGRGFQDGGTPQSEYGTIPNTLYAAFKVYF